MNEKRNTQNDDEESVEDAEVIFNDDELSNQQQKEKEVERLSDSQED